MSSTPPPKSEPAPHLNLPAKGSRPKSFTILGFVGCILGGLGILSVGGLATFGLIQGDPNMEHASLAVMTLNLGITFMGVLLSFLLMVASIGLLALRVWSRTMMIVVAWFDLAYDIAKVIVTLFLLLPMMAKVFRETPPPGMTPRAIAIFWNLYVAALVIMFVTSAGYAITALLLLNRPAAKAALKQIKTSEPPTM